MPPGDGNANRRRSDKGSEKGGGRSIHPALEPLSLKDHFSYRLEIVATLAMDTGYLIAALFARSLLLKALRHFAAPDALVCRGDDLPLALKAFELISDVGLVAGALIFMVFDVTKRAVWAARGFGRRPKSE